MAVALRRCGAILRVGASILVATAAAACAGEMPSRVSVLVNNYAVPARALRLAEMAAGDPSELTLTVLVYDYASLPGFELQNSMAVAQRIFGSAGVATKWIQCGTAHEPRPDSSCPGILGATDLVLNLVRTGQQGFADRQDRMGAALYDAEGRAGIIAYLFEQNVEQSVQLGGSMRFQVRGHVMAHEVGHLLLGAGAHSETGIMQPHWGVRQMARAPGSVTFTPEQARRIQANITTRIQAQESEIRRAPGKENLRRGDELF